MFKVLEQVKWSEVEINEIVALRGCNWIIIKEGEYDFRVLAEDLHETFNKHDESTKEIECNFQNKHDSWEFMSIKEAFDNNIIMINRLPKNVQNLWKIE
jgi:hypothetical protein